MEVLLEKAKKSGDLLVLVRFSKDTNFDPEKLEWYPRLDELELIDGAKKKIIENKK